MGNVVIAHIAGVLVLWWALLQRCVRQPTPCFLAELRSIASLQYCLQYVITQENLHVCRVPVRQHDEVCISDTG